MEKFPIFNKYCQESIANMSFSDIVGIFRIFPVAIREEIKIVCKVSIATYYRRVRDNKLSIGLKYTVSIRMYEMAAELKEIAAEYKRKCKNEFIESKKEKLLA